MNKNYYRTCYIDDVAFFEQIDDKGHVKAIPKQTKMYSYVCNPKDLELTDVERTYIIQKFLFFNEFYAYLYNEGYLRSDKYVSNVVIDEDEHSYSFTLNLGKIIDDEELMLKIKEVLNSSLCSFFIEKMQTDWLFSCEVCGEVCFNSYSIPNSYYIRNKGNYICCSTCKKLNYDKQAKVKRMNKNDIHSIIKVRNELIYAIDY